MWIKTAPPPVSPDRVLTDLCRRLGDLCRSHGLAGPAVEIDRVEGPEPDPFFDTLAPSLNEKLAPAFGRILFVPLVARLARMRAAGLVVATLGLTGLRRYQGHLGLVGTPILRTDPVLGLALLAGILLRSAGIRFLSFAADLVPEPDPGLVRVVAFFFGHQSSSTASSRSEKASRSSSTESSVKSSPPWP
ncbi:MAG TPA: hypothetical protein PLT11_06595, partial [Elusimicrobiota bacterium]|nr:hypothetical protein [Elusimicrobiota bacterium]